MQPGMVKYDHPPLAIMLSTPHFPLVRPSEATLNHFRPVVLAVPELGTFALGEGLAGGIGFEKDWEDGQVVADRA